jgi:hypothetical protein
VVETEVWLAYDQVAQESTTVDLEVERHLVRAGFDASVYVNEAKCAGKQGCHSALGALGEKALPSDLRLKVGVPIVDDMIGLKVGVLAGIAGTQPLIRWTEWQVNCAVRRLIRGRRLEDPVPGGEGNSYLRGARTRSPLLFPRSSCQ